MSIHPRRAQAEAEAAAWLDLHSDWAKGLPAEIRDTSVVGAESAPAGDGRCLPWYRVDNKIVGAPGPRDYEPMGLDGVECPRRLTGDEPSRASSYERPIGKLATRPVDYAALDVERRIVHDIPRESLVEFSVPPLPLPEIQLQTFEATSRTAVRAQAAEDTRQLNRVTVVIGQRIPSRLTYDQHTVDSHRYRTQSFSDLDRMGTDNRWMQQLAYAELINWLRIEAGCTDREIEALERRAAGQPVPDRHCLARAQRRAVASLV